MNSFQSKQQMLESDSTFLSLKSYVQQCVNHFHTNMNTKINWQSSHSNSTKHVHHQNKILMFQLKLYKKAFQLAVSDYSIIDKAKIILQNQTLSKNNQSLKTELAFRMKENLTLTKQIQSLESRFNEFSFRNKQLQKSKSDAQKIISQMNKLGGKTKYSSMLDQIKKLKQQSKELLAQNQRLKQKLALQAKKSKILTDLNKETEQKLAQIMVVQSKSYDSDLQNSKILCQNARKRGKSDLQMTDKKRLDIESLAAKQQMRKMRKMIDILQREKQQQKITFQQRQKIYSKMIIR